MELAFDLYTLSEPTPSAHAIDLVSAAVSIIVAWIAWRTVQRKKSIYRRFGNFVRIYIPVFLLLIAVSFLVAEGRLIAHTEQKTIAGWIDRRQYQVESGKIRNLEMKQRFWKSDPIPTFVVGSTRFEYGVYSKNSLLANYVHGGPLQDGRHVSLWHHDGLVLRMYATDKGRK